MRRHSTDAAAAGSWPDCSGWPVAARIPSQPAIPPWAGRLSRAAQARLDSTQPAQPLSAPSQHDARCLGYSGHPMCRARGRRRGLAAEWPHDALAHDKCAAAPASPRPRPRTRRPAVVRDALSGRANAGPWPTRKTLRVQPGPSAAGGRRGGGARPSGGAKIASRESHAAAAQGGK